MMESEHTHASHVGIRPLVLTLIIVVAIMVAEIIGGILSNSLALLGDAGHMLVDALALGLALFAVLIARRPATRSRTYGYHRVEIMAALANGTTLVLFALWIFYEAYQRLSEPPEIQTPIMLVVATVGLFANLAGMLLLQKASHDHLNIRAAFWHIIGDTISSLGVIVAGIIIALTGWYTVDPIVAFLIGLIILWGAVRIVRESADILMESVPRGVEVEKVISTIKNVPGVDDVHDLHVWTITSNVNALSAHLLIGDQTVSRSAEITAKVNEELAHNFNITHTTLQLECERCETCPIGFTCDINKLRSHSRNH